MVSPIPLLAHIAKAFLLFNCFKACIFIILQVTEPITAIELQNSRNNPIFQLLNQGPMSKFGAGPFLYLYCRSQYPQGICGQARPQYGASFTGSDQWI